MRSPAHRHPRRLSIAAAASLALLAACNDGDRAADTSAMGDTSAIGDMSAIGDTTRRDVVIQDSARGSVELPNGSRMNDSTMRGMQHATTPDERSARDTNHLFLRMMVDHHQGLIAMSDSLLARTATAAAKTDARQVREHQEAERLEMQRLLSGRFGEERTPRIMASNREMIDSVRKAPRGEGEAKAYYRQLIAHHREGVAMTQPMLATLTGDVRAMAERMVAQQTKEIEEFRKKAGEKQ